MEDFIAQLVALSPMIGCCTCMTILIVGFVILIVYLIKKQKADSWTGVVKDKMVRQKEDFDHPGRIETFYTLIVQTDDKRELKVGMSKEELESYKVGDRLEKRKGELKPKKIS